MIGRLRRGGSMARRSAVRWLVGIVVLLFASTGSLAQETESHWLVGAWEGELRDFAAGGGQGSPARGLAVTGITKDGVVQGTWGVAGRPYAPARISVDGTKLRIVSSVKSVIELERQGEDELAG